MADSPSIVPLHPGPYSVDTVYIYRRDMCLAYGLLFRSSSFVVMIDIVIVTKTVAICSIVVGVDSYLE